MIKVSKNYDPSDYPDVRICRPEVLRKLKLKHANDAFGFEWGLLVRERNFTPTRKKKRFAKLIKRKAEEWSGTVLQTSTRNAVLVARAEGNPEVPPPNPAAIYLISRISPRASSILLRVPQAPSVARSRQSNAIYSQLNSRNPFQQCPSVFILINSAVREPRSVRLKS